MKIADTFHRCKDKTDQSVISIIAENFNVNAVKVVQLFFTVKIKRFYAEYQNAD